MPCRNDVVRAAGDPSGGDFTVADSSGKSYSVANAKGKVVLIQFLYTTCSHCQAAARMYSKLAAEMAPRGFEVLGVAFNTEVQQNPAIVDEFVKVNDVQFPVGSAGYQRVLDYLGLSVMKRFVVPQIVVVGSERLRARTERCRRHA